MVTLIQAHWRGVLVRKAYLLDYMKDSSFVDIDYIIKIQALWRGKMVQQCHLLDYNDDVDLTTYYIIKIQALWRGRMVRPHTKPVVSKTKLPTLPTTPTGFISSVCI